MVGGENYSTEKCLVCGHEIKFYNEQYKKICPNCGTWVFQKKSGGGFKQDKKDFDCWICMDSGIVEYPVQSDGQVYKFVARCDCPKGMNWGSGVPLLSECKHAPEPEYIELRNREMCKQVWNG